MAEPVRLAAHPDLPWLAEFALPAGRLAGTGVAAVRRPGARRDLAAQHGLGEWLGIDLVHALANELFAAGVVPRQAELHLVAASGDALAPAAVAGVARACRGQGIALVVAAATPGSRTEVEVHCTGEVVARPAASVQPGDVVLGLRSSGPSDFDTTLLLARAGELGLALTDRRPGGDTVLRAVLAPRSSHASVLFEPITARWPGRLVAVGDGSLDRAVVSALPAGCAATIDLTTWSAPSPFGQWFPGDELYPVLPASSCGCGFLVVVREPDAARWLAHFAAWNEPAAAIGRIVAR